MLGVYFSYGLTEFYYHRINTSSVIMYLENARVGRTSSWVRGETQGLLESPSVLWGRKEYSSVCPVTKVDYHDEITLHEIVEAISP